MINQKKTVMEIALNFMRLQLKKGTWKTGDRLPGHQKLAELAGVGALNMWRAIALLKREKKLIARQKLGVFVGNHFPPKKPVSSEKTQTKWQVIGEQLKKDILTGAFGASEFLPSTKELNTRYQADFRTLKKAIYWLVLEKLLCPYNKRYRILLAQPAAFNKTIYFIISTSVFNLEMYSSAQLAMEQFVLELEKECSQKNIRLIKQEWTASLHIKDPSCIGFIVWHSPEVNDFVSEMAGWLNRFNKPVAVFFPHNGFEDEERSFIERLEASWLRYGFFISDKSRYLNAGQKMGNFLLGKDIKKVCLLAHSNNNNSNNYFHGIATSFSTAGLSADVTTLFYHDLTDAEKLRYSTAKDHTFEQSVTAEINFLENSKKTFVTNLSSPLKEIFAAKIDEGKFIRNHRSFFTPLFRKALNVADATAWVCYNDFLACHGVLEFFKAEGIKVPQQIGIVGCNNLTEASLHNLTTWHFDLAGTVRKMVSLIMYPEHSRKSLCLKGSTIFEIDGMVIDRGSVS